jgi:hypothetical protein
MTRIMLSTTCSSILCTWYGIASCRMMQHAQYATLICGVYDTHICHGASQSAYCCKSNTCSIFVMVTLCDASDGIVREHARGTWDVVPSDTMLSQHATCNIRHVHMVRRKQVMVPYPCDMVPHVTWCKTNRTPRCWLMPGRAGCLCC